MEKCYEYLGCYQRSCIMHENDSQHCWEVEGTLCSHRAIEIVKAKHSGKTKEEACARFCCLYYRAAKNRGVVQLYLL